MSDADQEPKVKNSEDASPADAEQKPSEKLPKEIGGQSGPEPTRYGDWEKNGIISDF
ncbi:MAG: DUF1674 domain-containing protein [Kordiimonadaceae bacterium]|nr:DUF1674 domain-containing protein [Kordiimonadaceae bacterium]MBO6568195.1 DUF1674 domain-containing protein [Kordiimonadaceae bacterium]MBO6964075.1 DUF1674 domain-containing protein [Kordiimonadaceae bacterium]